MSTIPEVIIGLCQSIDQEEEVSLGNESNVRAQVEELIHSFEDLAGQCELVPQNTGRKEQRCANYIQSNEDGHSFQDLQLVDEE